MFFEKEWKECGDVLGYVLVVNDYELGVEYIYYWGLGWSKYGFEVDIDWNKYLEEYVWKICNLLVVVIKWYIYKRVCVYVMKKIRYLVLLVKYFEFIVLF